MSESDWIDALAWAPDADVDDVIDAQCEMIRLFRDALAQRTCQNCRHWQDLYIQKDSKACVFGVRVFGQLRDNPNFGCTLFEAKPPTEGQPS